MKTWIVNIKFFRLPIENNFQRKNSRWIVIVPIRILYVFYLLHSSISPSSLYFSLFWKFSERLTLSKNTTAAYRLSRAGGWEYFRSNNVVHPYICFNPDEVNEKLKKYKKSVARKMFNKLRHTSSGLAEIKTTDVPEHRKLLTMALIVFVFNARVP